MVARLISLSFITSASVVLPTAGRPPLRDSTLGMVPSAAGHGFEP